MPIEEIERRLGADITAARQDDRHDAAVWLAAGRGAGFEDLAIPNDRRLREVAEDVLGLLDWP